MKKRKTISKHDIIRVLNQQEGKLNYLLEAINGLHFNINSYVEMRGDTDDYRAHMEKKIKSGNPNPVQDNKG